MRGHVLLCMLAYYVEWHLWRRLAPLPFEEQDGKAAHERRDSPVEKAQARESAQAKTDSKHPPTGSPGHSLKTLLADLGALTLHERTLPDAPDHSFPLFARPTLLQERTFDLIAVDSGRFAARKLAG